MPPKRRSAATAGPTQSTLAFHGQNNKVTKASKLHSAGHATKDKLAAPTPTSKETKPAVAVIVDDEKEEEEEEEEEEDDSEKEEEEDRLETAEKLAEPVAEKAPVEAIAKKDTKEEKVEEELAVPVPVSEVSAQDQEALKVTNAQIKSYWKAKEAARKAPRVHQEDLTMEEKILREWDISSQYGPCIGITRTKRWNRAHKLNLNPPIEVLAILLNGTEELKSAATATATKPVQSKRASKDLEKLQRAHIDELLSTHTTIEP